MNPETFAVHRRQNRRHSLLLIAGMATVLALSGWLLGGRGGLAVALVVSGSAIVFAPQASSKLLLKMYRAQPLPPATAPDVLRVFDTLAARGELDPPPRLYYVPSQMPNAFAVGLGRDAAVAVTDGLLRMLSLRELAGVLAHEISHIRHRDTRVMALADVFSRMTTSLSQVGQVLLFLSLPAVLMGSSPLPLGGVVALVLAPSASVLMQLALSRSREFDADLGAVELTGDPDGLASALLKLERWQEGPWWKRILLPTPTTREPAMLRTHPHTAARVERLQNLHPEAGEGVAARLAIPSSLASVALSPVPRRPRWHLTGTWY